MDSQVPGWSPLGQTGVSFQALVTQLANNNLQLSALLNDLNTTLKGIGLVQFAAVPANSASPGVAGQISYDATHLYLCVASNSWIRFTGSTF